MGKLISCGNCSKYYFYILISLLTRFIKEDVLGISIDGKVLTELKVQSHPIIVLLIGYVSDFLLSFLAWLFIYYRKRKNQKKLNSTKIENGEYSSKKPTPDKIFELKDDLNGNVTTDEEKDNEDSKKSDPIKSDNNLKYELIYNDLNLQYSRLSKRSIYFLLMSSCLIVIKEMITKIIYSIYDIFDFYFLHLITITIIMRCFFKNKIYKHHLLSIIAISITAVVYLILSFHYIQKNSKEEGNEMSYYFDLNSNSYYIFILFFIYIIISICFCTGLIFQKNLMQEKYIASYKLLFCKGFFGIVFCIIVLAITTNAACQNLEQSTNGITPDFPDNNTNSTDFEIPFKIIFCSDDYNNETFYDNFYSYFTYNPDVQNDNMNEAFILFSYFILNFISNLSFLLINKFLTPNHCLITESLYFLMHIPFKYYIIGDSDEVIQKLEKEHKENDLDKLSVNFFLKEGIVIILSVAYVLEIICHMIYLEIIQLNFCKLNRDLVKNIKKRAKADSLMSEKELNEEESEIDDSLEISVRYTKKKNNYFC